MRVLTLVVPGVIIPAYSGSIISYLTVLNPKIPFTDLESLAADGTYKVYTVDHNYTRTFFQVYAFHFSLPVQFK